MIPLSRKAFRKFLEINARKNVGDPSDTHSCPFCHFLKSKGAKRVRINILWRAVDGERYEHRGWQREFQRAAMNLREELDVEELRGREALSVLDSL